MVEESLRYRSLQESLINRAVHVARRKNIVFLDESAHLLRCVADVLTLYTLNMIGAYKEIAEVVDGAPGSRDDRIGDLSSSHQRFVQEFDARLPRAFEMIEAIVVFLKHSMQRTSDTSRRTSIEGSIAVPSSAVKALLTSPERFSWPETKEISRTLNLLSRVLEQLKNLEWLKIWCQEQEEDGGDYLWPICFIFQP